jgi:ABC-type multidrug transport system ATPase subunit
MLKATLDHLGVKNDNGLVDEEPAFFKELTAEKVNEIVNVLKGEHPVEHIRLYLAFVGVPGEALKVAA